MTSFHDLPGPTPIPIFGNALQLAGRDLHTQLEAWRAEHGDLYRFYLFAQPSLVTAKPAQVREVLVDRAEEWIKGLPRAATAPVGRSSVFRSPGGEDWKQKRAAHPFEAPWIERWYDGIYPVLRARIEARLAEIAAGTRLDLYQEILRASFDCFSLGVFGELLGDDAFVEHETLLREVGRRGAVPISWDPVFWIRRKRWFDRLEKRMARGDLGGTDMVSALARHGGDVRSDHARDELSNVFAAGMKNAAIAASALFYFLGRAPDVRQRLAREIGELGTHDRRSLLGLDLLDRATKEALRLIPPVAGFAREVAPGRAVALAGIPLPKKTQIFLVPWIVHRNADIWPDPLRFDPDRFLAEPEPGAYFPFGLGQRFCVGRDWTILFAKTCVATLLARSRIEIDPGATFETKLVAALTVPKDGLPAIAH